MIVGRIVEEWDRYIGRYVRVDPVCDMAVGDFGTDERCGKPATVRRNYWPHWSVFWCSEHADLFADPREFFPGYFDRMPNDTDINLDEPTIWRR